MPNINLTLTKATLEPGRAHVIGAYQPGVCFLIEGDLESYALIAVQGDPNGLPLEPPILVIEDGNIQLTATPGKSCVFNDNGLFKVQNDRVGQNINIGYIFIPYKSE